MFTVPQAISVFPRIETQSESRLPECTEIITIKDELSTFGPARGLTNFFNFFVDSPIQFVASFMTESKQGNSLQR